MKSNQSLHLTIKEPPNPNPVRTLAIFDDPKNPSVPKIIQTYLSEVEAVPKDATFIQNVKDEVAKSLKTGKVLTVARKGKLLHVIIEEP